MNHPLWSIIDYVYVINCNKARWERMKERLDPIVPREKLVKFSSVTEQDDRVKQVFDNSLPKRMMRMLCCALSHMDIWKIAQHRSRLQDFDESKDRVKQYSIILEDDVFFRRDWMEVVYGFLMTIDYFDPNWDMLQLNAQGFHDWTPHGLKKCDGMLLSGGYILSTRGMDQLIEWFAENNETTCKISSDYRLVRLQERGHSYFYFPYLALQEFEDSTIANDNDPEDQNHVRNLRTWQESNYKPTFGHLYDWCK